MMLLGLTVVLYTALMLALHLLSMRLMKGWDAKGENRIKRLLPAMRALHIEGCYWLLALAAWPLWTFLSKVLVAVLATLHIGVWAMMEWKRSRSGMGFARVDPASAVAKAIASFDLVEAFALIILGYSAVAFLLGS